MMRQNLNKGLKYKIVSVCFVIGIIFLLLPFSEEDNGEVLPQTGGEAELEAELIVDETDIQRDDPTEEAQTINYRVKVRNKAECVSEPVNVMFINDKSGSMKDSMKSARQAQKEFIQRMDSSKDKAGIIFYDKENYLVRELTSSKSELIDAIDSLSISGLTNVGAAIESAKEELLMAESNSDGNLVIILLSDGRTNRPLDKDSKQYAVEKATEAKNAGIRIITFVYGDYADKELMQEFASTGSGNYYFEPDEMDIFAVYSDISKNLQEISFDNQVSIDLSQVENIVDLASISSGGIYSDGQLKWEVGSLECQEAVFLEFSLNINNNAADFDRLNLIAEVINSEGLSALSQNVTTTIHAPAFNFSKTDNKDEVLPWDKLEYEIVVENVGSGNAYGVVITDFLPEEHFIVMPRSSSDNGELIEKKVIWDNEGEGYNFDGFFAPMGNSWGSSKRFSFWGYVDKYLGEGVFTIVNSAELKTAGKYFQSTKDITVVRNGPDLSIAKETNPSLYSYPGGEITYTLRVKNEGLAQASLVRVTDSFDENYLLVTSEEGNVKEGEVWWLLESLAVGEEKTFTYKAKVIDSIIQDEVTLSGEASVTLQEDDLNKIDNVALNEIVVTTDPVISLKQTSEKTTYKLDEEIEYHLIISNNSYADADDLVLKGSIPFEFDYVPGTTRFNEIKVDDPIGKRSLEWEIGSLVRSESIDVTFRVEPNRFCDEGNYLTEATIDVKEEGHALFESQAFDLVVTIVREEVLIGAEDIISKEGKRSNRWDLFTNFLRFNTQKNLVKLNVLIYLKVLLGVVLALPLPLMLILDREEKRIHISESRRRKRPKKKLKAKGSKR